MPRLAIGLFIAFVTLNSAHAADPLGVGSALGLSASPSSVVSGTSSVVPDPMAASKADAAQQPGSSSQSVPAIRPVQPKGFDYSVNIYSDVFGAQLFSGAFARQGATQFNPDYLIAVGDKLNVRMWGAFELEQSFVVDPKGNIFLPHVGPVRVLGVRNQDLQTVVDNSIRKVFKANVFSYASLAAAQPVRVFVSGFVYRPGLYSGTSMDSLLHYLDQAGGIDVERGSFLDIQVKRDGNTRAKFNLYEFLLEGKLPLVQLGDGDVIFVAPRKNMVRVTGLAENAKRFEFDEKKFSVANLMRVAKPFASATHFRVTRNTGPIRSTDYYPLTDASKVMLDNGDEFEFTADKKPGTITVRVEGEHMSHQEYVMPYGSRLGELMSKIELNERSESESLQLFRVSVKERQKQMLLTSLKSLESAALTARSGTGEEALLRKQEAELLLQWVDRAKTIEPTGQVYMATAKDKDGLLLENGDVLRIPVRDGLVLINGEVLFPNALIYDKDLSVDDYIKRAGGYTQNADVSRVIIAHRDGSFNDAKNDGASIKAGDQILVLPKIDTKSRQFFKDITQIIYQIAVSAKIVFGL